MLHRILFFNLFVCVFLAFSSLASEQGKIILDIKEPNAEEINYKNLYEEYLKELDIFDAKYPGNRINEGFRDDVAQIHPEYDDSQVDLKEKAIYWGVRGRRIYNFIKDEIQKFMLENELPLQLNESDYATSAPEEYKASEKPLVIEDFKKVISYSADNADMPSPSWQQKKTLIKKAILEKDWKSLFSYLLYDGKALDDEQGIGAWETQPQLQARLMSEDKKIVSTEAIKGALQIYIPQPRFVLLRDYLQNAGLKISFSDSQNVSDVKLNLIMPQRFFVDLESSFVGYAGTILLPFVVYPQDAAKPVTIKAKIEASSCLHNECAKTILEPKLNLDVGTQKEASLANSMLQIQQYFAPQTSLPELKLTDLIVEKTPEGNVLQLKAIADKTPAAFQVYIEGEGAEEFLPPLVRIDGNEITARFIPLDPKTELVGRQFSIIASVAPNLSVRSLLTAKTSSLFSVDSNQLTLGLIWLAFVGGLLLNIMPCVFPVLALKIVSFGNFGNSNLAKIRRDFSYNILGIMASFVVLIAILISLKMLGQSIGWGMQFQNHGFLVVMIFVIAGFIAHLWGLIHLPFPNFLEKFIRRQHSEAIIQFLNGAFLVLLATPCTAPYLGTALGIALSGSPLQIAVVVSMVGLGLATPYILFALFPSLSYFMPRPGKWLRTINNIMFLMLMATIIWLLSILSAQTGFSFGWQYFIYIVCFWFVLYIRRSALQSLDIQSQNEEPIIYITVRRWINLLALILLTVIVSLAYFNTSSVVRKHQQVISATKQQDINMPQIKQYLSQGNSVLLKVGAEWCLTCSFNNVVAFNTPQIQDILEKYRVQTMEIDWTNYQADVLQFMQKFGFPDYHFMFCLPQGCRKVWYCLRL